MRPPSSPRLVRIALSRSAKDSALEETGIYKGMDDTGHLEKEVGRGARSEAAEEEVLGAGLIFAFYSPKDRILRPHPSVVKMCTKTLIRNNLRKVFHQKQNLGIYILGVVVAPVHF
jgi:hypothetical protein